jgi:hypothetical protein
MNGSEHEHEHNEIYFSLINDSIVHCESVPMIGVGDDICDEQTCDF